MLGTGIQSRRFRWFKRRGRASIPIHILEPRSNAFWPTSVTSAPHSAPGTSGNHHTNHRNHHQPKISRNRPAQLQHQSKNVGRLAYQNKTSVPRVWRPSNSACSKRPVPSSNRNKSVKFQQHHHQRTMALRSSILLLRRVLWPSQHHQHHNNCRKPVCRSQLGISRMKLTAVVHVWRASWPNPNAFRTNSSRQHSRVKHSTSLQQHTGPNLTITIITTSHVHHHRLLAVHQTRACLMLRDTRR